MHGLCDGATDECNTFISVCIRTQQLGEYEGMLSPKFPKVDVLTASDWILKNLNQDLLVMEMTAQYVD